MKDLLATTRIEASAPCRIDMGGTLDISTFFYPLRHLSPCTFNLAINLRTRVRLLPYETGMIKISSKGFDSAEYPFEKAPFDHPLGLMFAVAAYFRAAGVHIMIDSSSPPRSGLGGSSAAAVALIGAFSCIFEQEGAKALTPQQMAILAHALEGSVAGVPCGLQDQLAAAFGGAHAWYWQESISGPPYRGEALLSGHPFEDLESRLLLVYCGTPHESKNTNSQWVQQFVRGSSRERWTEIVFRTQEFLDAFRKRRFSEAAKAMNKEMVLRKGMTPEVLNKLGEKLFEAAVGNSCGARITGAGGGGCIWALGEIEDIHRLKNRWAKILKEHPDACFLDAGIATDGVLVNKYSCQGDNYR
ncbi:galactokinase [Thermodesulfobacteriota bacterium]